MLIDRVEGMFSLTLEAWNRRENMIAYSVPQNQGQDVMGPASYPDSYLPKPITFIHLTRVFDIPSMAP
jgi:hypothetical protein